MNSDLHYQLFVAEQHRRGNQPRHDRPVKPRLRHRAGDALVNLGQRLREHPPDPYPAPQRG